MQVKQIMTKHVETIRPDETLQQAAKKMKSLDVGMLPVTNNGNLMGAITDRDITVRATAQGADLNSMRVRDIMTNNVVSAFEDQDVKEAARLMQDKQLRRLPVINRAQKLVGIVALADLATDVSDKKMAGQVLEQVTQPEKK